MAGGTPEIQENSASAESEQRSSRTLRFLVRLNQQLQPLADPDEIMAVTARMLGEHLGANRCAYAEVEEDQDHFVITGDHTRDTFSIVGRFAMSDFGAEAHRLMLEGKPYVVDDAATDPRVGPAIAAYRQTDIAAVISVPLLKAGRFVAGMAVHFKTPHRWAPHEVELVTLIVNRCWDSIERARTLRRLREQLELTETMTNNATQALLMMDARGYCTFVNPAGEAMLGWKLGELQEKPLHEYIHYLRPDGRPYPMAECPIDRALPENFDVREHEDVFVRRNGEFFPVLVAASPIFRNGRPASTVIEVRDITERKRAEESLRESARRLRLVLDSMPQKIFTATAAGEVDYFNPQWSEFTGLSFEEIRSSSGWTRFIHPDDLAENARLWQHSIETGEPFQFEHRFRRYDGEYRWHLSRALPLRDAAGEIVMWIGADTEVHAIKAAEKALREADRMKDEFLATLSHELRTPLTAISGWAQLLASGQLGPAEQNVALAAIRASATAQSQLVEDVLDVSRITTGKMRVERRPADLRAIVEAAVATIRPAAEAKGIPLSLMAEPDLGKHFVDPGRIQQVVWNLLSNAVKFSPRGAPIEVTMRSDGATTVIGVRDRGAGIAADFLPHIFERFRQADSSSTRTYAGLGLGLSLARELMELHGGTIAVESEEGRGAYFEVRLPSSAVPADDKRAAHSAADADAPRPLDGVRVLYVDDRDDARLLIAAMLRNAGAEVSTAASAAEALEQLARAIPHVVVTDIAMPHRDGFDLLDAIRDRTAWRDIPVVALTAHGESDPHERTAAAGFNAFLSKPIEVGVLTDAVARAARSRSLSRSR